MKWKRRRQRRRSTTFDSMIFGTRRDETGNGKKTTRQIHHTNVGQKSIFSPRALSSPSLVRFRLIMYIFYTLHLHTHTYEFYAKFRSLLLKSAYVLMLEHFVALSPRCELIWSFEFDEHWERAGKPPETPTNKPTNKATSNSAEREVSIASS